ncbi:disulfide bond formation protein DsbA [Georhizobium profundi]|jgi:protein-disulfide isomerase|uniref:Disulfide bond formation protein DsbA n=2 Tax=Hyphomicrobiales TaxID=356 RepID=A0A3S9AZA5_9HYPH|nr:MULTISPECIES: thioredoxin domain-containing protein [Hyphomicrobiales]AZN70034.1 disulfide bond formation protein DsbA [Georhizobium profundi]MCO6390004.1 thioredoxin domain-containing protein [Aliihoeflea aestuarii]TYR29517.1 thioredoxin domain-containing protein [Mesorhizobium microcysteis]
MNRRQVTILSVGLAAGAIFGASALYYNRARSLDPSGAEALVREHSPVMGPPDAPVTIVEFFDPSCEACRAFHPLVKNILAQYPDDVRVVFRYAAFHDGSDQAVGIIEAARRQDLFVPVLEALLDAQPEWAIHGNPNLDRAWQAAAAAGLDLERAREDATTAEVAAVLRQDTSDVDALGVRQTPTFFVNGKSLQSFGPQQLIDLVSAEVRSARESG